MTPGADNSPGTGPNPRGSTPGQTEIYGSQSGGMATTSHGRSAGTRACPKCGSAVSAHASVCPICGESLKGPSQQIRCRYCGEKSSAELTLCPRCGRELTSAPPRWLTLAIPAVLAVLFLALMVGQVEQHNPLAWAQDRLTIEGLTQREPDRGIVVVMTPVAESDSDTEAVVEEATPVTSALAVDLENDQLTAAQVGVARVVATAADDADASGDANAESEQTDESSADGDTGAVEEVELVPTESSESADSTEPEEASPTDAAVEGSAVDSEPEAASNEGDTQSASATAEPTGEAVVEEASTDNAAGDESEDGAFTGDEQDADAGEESTEKEEPLLALVASSAGGSRAAILPTATPTSPATATPFATPTPSQTPTETAVPTATYVPMPEHTIQRGDTLLAITQRYDVDMDDLMRVNDISAIDAFALQPGEKLTIPVEGSLGAAEPTATSTPTVTETPVVPPTNTPLPTPTAPAYRVDAPILRSPEPGTPMNCSTADSLVWLPVPFMRDSDQFVLHLGFVSGRMEDGREMVVWVLEQPRPSITTSWDMDGTLCALAPQEYGRKWKWYVEVVENIDGNMRAVSPPSETWDFTWN